MPVKREIIPRDGDACYIFIRIVFFFLWTFACSHLYCNNLMTDQKIFQQNLKNYIIHFRVIYRKFNKSL